MSAIRQPSFAAGELDPKLHSRSDVPKYLLGLKKCLNFFVDRRGAAISRPGTKYICEVKDSTKATRLVPFVFSDGQSFALEFGHQAIRFYTQGGRVETSPGVAYTLATTYDSAHVFRLKFAQVGDVITITHQSYAPMELKRASNTSWTITPMDFSALARTSGLGTLFTASATTPPTPAAYVGATTNVVGDTVTSGGHGYRSLQAANVGHTPGADNQWWQLDDSLLGRKWTVAVTALWQGTDGLIRETLPYAIASGATFPVSAERTASYTTANGALALVNPVWGYRFYRGPDNELGLVGSMAAAGTFTDVGDEPDYTRQPPQGTNPFVTASPGSTFFFHRNYYVPGTSSDYPACVANYEGRRAFAGTPGKPGTTFLSESGNYYNFDDCLLKRKDSPLELDLASRRLLVIRSMLALGRKLVHFGDSAIWSLSGHVGNALAFDSVDAKCESEMGASWLAPLALDNSVLFVRAKGTGVREVFWRKEFDGLAVVDLSLFSEHFFAGHQVVDWAYAEDPWSLVWAVRDDGALLSLSYLKDEQVLAWAQHDTDGTYESVCAIPNGTADDVYFIVNRTINGATKRYVEVQADRYFTEATDVTGIVCLDCAATYDGAATTSIPNLSHLEAKSVYALADGSVQGPFTVTSGAITLGVAASTVHVGLLFTPKFEPLPITSQAKEVRALKKTVSKASVEVYASRGVHAGPDYDNLREFDEREVADGFSALALRTRLIELYFGGDWGPDGSFVISQPQPLPLTILAITREVELADY